METRQPVGSNPNIIADGVRSVVAAGYPQAYGHLWWVNAGAPRRQPGVGRTGLLMGGLLAQGAAHGLIGPHQPYHRSGKVRVLG